MLPKQCHTINPFRQNRNISKSKTVMQCIFYLYFLIRNNAFLLYYRNILVFLCKFWCNSIFKKFFLTNSLLSCCFSCFFIDNFFICSIFFSLYDLGHSFKETISIFQDQNIFNRARKFSYYGRSSKWSISRHFHDFCIVDRHLFSKSHSKPVIRFFI